MASRQDLVDGLRDCLWAMSAVAKPADSRPCVIFLGILPEILLQLSFHGEQTVDPSSVPTKVNPSSLLAKRPWEESPINFAVSTQQLCAIAETSMINRTRWTFPTGEVDVLAMNHPQFQSKGSAMSLWCPAAIARAYVPSGSATW